MQLKNKIEAQITLSILNIVNEIYGSWHEKNLLIILTIEKAQMRNNLLKEYLIN